MGRAVGGYVRRSERKPASTANLLREYRRAQSWWFREITWQSMPILHFEPFIIAEDDTGIYLDADGMTGLRSNHDRRTR